MSRTGPLYNICLETFSFMIHVTIKRWVKCFSSVICHDDKATCYSVLNTPSTARLRCDRMAVVYTHAHAKYRTIQENTYYIALVDPIQTLMCFGDCSNDFMRQGVEHLSTLVSAGVPRTYGYQGICNNCSCGTRAVEKRTRKRTITRGIPVRVLRSTVIRILRFVDCASVLGLDWIHITYRATHTCF